MDLYRFKTARLYAAWLNFKKKRKQDDYNFDHSNPFFLTMNEREDMIDELFKRLGYYEA